MRIHKIVGAKLAQASRKVRLFSGVLLLCLSIVARADDAQTDALKLGITIPKYPALRIGDLAPEWTAKDASDKVWSSRDFLGKTNVLLLTEWHGQFLFDKDLIPDSPEIIAEATAARLKKLGVQPVWLRNWLPTKLEKDGSLLQLNYGRVSPLQGNFIHDEVLVSLSDRAGFVRAFSTVWGSRLVDSLAQLTSPQDPTPKLEIGKVAPDFSMMDMNGNVRRAADLRGRKNLVLTFFPKCFTGGCANHLSSLQKELPIFTANDTEIWAVSVDAAHVYDESNSDVGQIAFAKKLGLEFPLIPDVGRNLCLLYGTVKTPDELSARASILIDKNGIVRAIDNAVITATHGRDVLNQMAALGMLQSVNTKKSTPE